MTKYRIKETTKGNGTTTYLVEVDYLGNNKWSTFHYAPYPSLQDAKKYIDACIKLNQELSVVSTKYITYP